MPTINPISQTKNRILHGIAQIDARESILRQAPLRRIGLPLMGTGLGLAVSVFDYQQAPDTQSKRKVLVRDGLVLGGIATSSILASYLVNRTQTSKWMLHQIEDGLKYLFGRFKKFQPGSSHVHGADEYFPGKPLDRLKLLFKADLHDHGLQGALDLSLLSAIPIFLGGIPAGLIADKLNGESLGKTGPVKIKEGLFQFLGNITVCTIAILGFSKLGKATVSKLWQLPKLQSQMIQNTRNGLLEMAKRPKDDLALIPTQLTGDIERIFHEHKAYPKNLLNALNLHLSQITVRKGMKWHEYNEGLQRLIQQGPFNKKAIHQYVRGVFGPAFKEHAQDVVHQPEALRELAQLKFESRGETLGVIGGLIAGVVGGAWVSNGINAGLSKLFHWPTTHESPGLFQRQTNQSSATGSEQNKGWLSGTVGERGIHWYDGILHLDDVPSALYLGGVRAVESMIQVLYGISGFLAGTAGTNYSQALPVVAALKSKVDSQLNLPTAFQAFLKGHPYPVTQNSPFYQTSPASIAVPYFPVSNPAKPSLPKSPQATQPIQ
ncbi:hypothetical protein [Vampirovibrio sp.]|uniref:hypothetical protein n=1 Tax=Vampirovibrio sp. TaxID=2717857 RepID=UPI0035948E64